MLNKEIKVIIVLIMLFKTLTALTESLHWLIIIALVDYTRNIYIKVKHSTCHMIYVE